MNLVETKQASLDTLSVTIKALHVAGKQMTLAVFRQLPIMELNNDCSPWGTVRYSIKDQGNLWLVHSYNNCLYRMILNINKPNNYHLNGLKEKLKNPNYYYCYEIPKHGIEQEISNRQFEYDTEFIRHELHTKYLNNYPQLFIAI
jgi:hypothetical protein